ncbi:MAG: TIGR04282 family arsenosugar biosynthesis glycosyltransferase [Gammaproteobacteria bacterium]|jgi:rSAM/selenodomain-associated transferase 1
MTDSKIEKKAALIIFAKSPEPGRVKTRLITDIGVDAATKLYKELLTRTLTTSINSTFTEKQLWLSGVTENSFFDSYKQAGKFKFKQQAGKDLGERMCNAFENVLSEYDYAVIIGCDCPGLTNDDLKLAADMLESDRDMVLGPAEDGGYYLIALKKNYAELFSGIEWGGENVFSKTMLIAENLGLSVGLLEKRNDVDRVTDIPFFEDFKKQECLV